MFASYGMAFFRALHAKRKNGLDLQFAPCELSGMEAPPTYATLSEKAGISLSYANQILSGARTPAKPLLIHILRKTGWRHPGLDGLSDEQLSMLETIEPWTPTAERAA